MEEVKQLCLYCEGKVPISGGGKTLAAILEEAGWQVMPALANNTLQLRPGVGVIQVAPGALPTMEKVEQLVRNSPNSQWVVVAPADVLCRRHLGVLTDSRSLFVPWRQTDFQKTVNEVLAMVEQAWRQWRIRAPFSRGQYRAQHGILGNSPRVRQLLGEVAKLARTNAPVLITGESGTGKELIARAIHYSSPRAGKPLVPVNCGAITPGLIQSELFGHEAGAFTGANQRYIGLIERAAGGTLFLDEIGELPLEQQANLLRVLQEKTVRRVGGKQDIFVDVRVIAATHRDLNRVVCQGSFREDLYYRLAVLQIESPPLRQRSKDIELLAGHFLARFAAERDGAVPGLSGAALEAMRNHSWPGNVRELMNRVNRAVVMAEGAIIEPEDLGLATNEDNAGSRPGDWSMVGSDGSGDDLESAKRDAERRALLSALTNSGYNVTQASRELGISRASMYRLMTKHNIQRDSA